MRTFQAYLRSFTEPIDVHDVDSIFEDNFGEVGGANFLDFPFAIRVPRRGMSFLIGDTNVHK